MFVAQPPLIGDHAVCVRKRAGADGRVSGARHRIEIRISCVVEDQARVEQGSKSPMPLSIESLYVVGAHLIDDENHEQLRCTLRLRPWLPDDDERKDCDKNYEQEDYTAHVEVILTRARLIA